jgi:hypothetical protein
MKNIQCNPEMPGRAQARIPIYNAIPSLSFHPRLNEVRKQGFSFDPKTVQRYCLRASKIQLNLLQKRISLIKGCTVL